MCYSGSFIVEGKLRMRLIIQKLAACHYPDI